jgi:CxxC motif-containing protein (DUF1111 family)
MTSTMTRRGPGPISRARLARQGLQAAPLALAMLLAACGGNGGDADTPGNATASTMSRSAARVAAESPLTPVKVSASNSERGDLGPQAAVDGDPGTRWSSGFTDNEHLQLDFGAPVLINRVSIDWENARATEYVLEVSNDERSWTVIKHVTDSQGGSENLTGLNSEGRFLRMRGIKRNTGYGYSIFEIKAYTGGAVTEPPLPEEPQPPVDTTKPGVAIKPVGTSGSPVEGNNTTAAAIDGNMATRWGSAHENGAYIVFDFGAKKQIGYMKLIWENAYGREYKLRASDDGTTWTDVRHVTDGKGGTEEFFNLGINARYVQLQGYQRATTYGYSLYEVEFKTPGSDNTLPLVNTTPLPYPANGGAMTPLPGSTDPVESLQFTLPDGTLVTRFGARGLARHGRERGEEWNEVGYGPNETIDANGNPVDKGPGNYLSFVPQYFQNRTWGVEIIDNSRVAGVTKPTLIVNQYTQTDFLSGGIAFFRAFDRPGDTGYGWMAPGELVDNSIKVCKPVPYPANGRLTAVNGINNGCTLQIKDYPGHRALGPDGFPNGLTLPARPLVAGDVIEVSPSMFTTKEALAAKGDFGGERYYSYEWVYVVGQGLRPWYGVQPRLNSVPLPESTLSGGLGSVSYNYTDEGNFMFQQPHTNIGMRNMQRFVEGRRLLHTNFTTGRHSEVGNDRYDPAVGLQGQRFSQSVCIACHVNNGRSPAPLAGQRLDTMGVRTAVLDADGKQLPHPKYGISVQMNAYSASATPQNWGTNVRVAGVESRTVTLGDGTPVKLSKPTVSFEGGAPQIYSLRAAQPMIGVGLLEAIPEADILARVRATPDEDGVKGVANFVFDPESGAVRMGRFGWKASKATLRHQSAEALLLDMAVTSPVYPNRACATDPATCKSQAAQRGVSDAELKSISEYLALVAVPAQRSLPSGFPKFVSPLPEHNVDPAKVAAGSKLFQGLRCVACHTAEMKTGSTHLFAELRNQTIRPYTDLLLHDMGEGLADDYAEGQAKGNMWRTSPLWGIGYTEMVMANKGKVGYLHDGRAANLTEAIMWHGGEAEKSKQRFANLSKADREALLAFLKSL